MHAPFRRRPRIIARCTPIEQFERRTLLAIATPAFAPVYQQTWVQDFTAMNSLSVSAYGPVGVGGSTWIAHKPKGGDWFPFSDPNGKLNPFDVDSNGLTIRVQKNGNPNNGFNGYTGGLLASVDDDGNGFAQQYGYFEVSMKTPGGANTWPAFWLLSRNGLVDPSIDVAEVDVTESYGNYAAGPSNNPAGNPNVTTAAWHQWNADGTHTSNGHPVEISGLSTGYHTYGVDIEPTGLTYYVDRQVAWTAPIFEAAKQPMYLLLDLALGGGSYNNASGTGYDWNLTPAVADLSVQYVSVWASPASPNYSSGLSAGVTGSTIGTTGSWLTGNTGVYAARDGASAAFDGDLATSFDAPASTNGQGVWAGLDLGTPKLITELSFAPRSGFNDRMIGGKFQASNTADFNSGVIDLYRIPNAPGNGMQTITVNSGTAFRYVRYLSPSGGWGNIAEMSLRALKPPAIPAGVTAVATTGSQIDLAWNAVTGATSYNIYRSTTPGGQGTTPIATGVAGLGFSDLTVSPGTTYYYKLAAVNPSGIGPQSAEASATPAGAASIDLTGTTIGTTGSWLTGNTGLYTASDGASAAFDGNLGTSFDAPSSSGGNGVWVGEDLGTASVITQITFAPRSNFIDRMIGGRFQASNTADFSSGVIDLYTITGTPSIGLQTVMVNNGTAFRYIRYLSPAGGWGNIAEMALRGTTSAGPPVVTPPATPPTPPPTPTPPPAPPVTPPATPAAPIITSQVVSTGSRQSVAGTPVSFTTNLPSGSWIWGAGWSWAAPFVSATWDAPNLPANIINLPDENMALGVSIAGAGAYTKPTSLTVSGQLYALGSNGTKVGLGFWSSMPPRADGVSSLTNFTGLVLDQANGTLQVYVNGSASGSAVSVGTITSNVGYDLKYTVDTSTGGVSNITLNGSSVLGLSSVGFTSVATSFAGVIDFAASRAGFRNFSVG